MSWIERTVLLFLLGVIAVFSAAAEYRAEHELPECVPSTFARFR